MQHLKPLALGAIKASVVAQHPDVRIYDEVYGIRVDVPLLGHGTVSAIDLLRLRERASGRCATDEAGL